MAPAAARSHGLGGVIGGRFQWRQVREYAQSPESKGGWERLQKSGHKINPCNSPKHPAAVAGIPLADGPKDTSLQAGPSHGVLSSDLLHSPQLWYLPLRVPHPTPQVMAARYL